MKSNTSSSNHRGRRSSERSLRIFVGSFASLVFVLGIGCQAEFQGTSVSPNEPASTRQVSPKEQDLPGQELPPEICSASHMAARLFFVVDNSNSHGYLEAGKQERSGTDPVRVGLSVRGVQEAKTYRQEALYTIIKRTAELDALAKKSSPDFLGTEVGISYFPKYRGDGNPNTRYEGELDDLGQYVNITGADGPAAKVFPRRMTDLSSVTGDFSQGSALDNELWNGFSFTHTPGGSTPYATGLRSAVENLDPKSSESAGDKRKNIVIMLTDGLPTDETPSAIVAARSLLGESTQVFIVSVYDPAEDPTLSNSPFFNNLKQAFLGQASWGTKPNNPDKYPKTQDGFNAYWKDLLAAPGKIATQILRVPEASKLSAEIDKILDANTTCRSPEGSPSGQ